MFTSVHLLCAGPARASPSVHVVRACSSRCSCSLHARFVPASLPLRSHPRFSTVRIWSDACVHLGSRHTCFVRKKQACPIQGSGCACGEWRRLPHESSSARTFPCGVDSASQLADRALLHTNVASQATPSGNAIDSRSDRVDHSGKRVCCSEICPCLG